METPKVEATEDAAVASTSSNKRVRTSAPETRDESSALPEHLPSDEENWSSDSSLENWDTMDRVVKVQEARHTFEQGKNLVFYDSDYERGAAVLKSACKKYYRLYTPTGQQCGDVLTTYGLSLLLLRQERARVRQREREMEESEVEIENRVGTETDEKCMEEVRTEIKDEQETKEVAEEEAAPETSSAIDRMEKETTEDNLERMISLRIRMAEKFPSTNNYRRVDELLEEEEEEEEEEEVEEKEQQQPVEETEEEIKRMDDLDSSAAVKSILKVFISAKNIYAVHKDYVNLAYVLSKVGEVALEVSDFGAAINNFENSLNLLEMISSSDSDYMFQKINLHFQLHLAYLKDHHLREAGIELTKALTIASKYLPQLREKLAISRSTGNDDEELSEIEELLKCLTGQAASFPEVRQTILTFTRKVQNLMSSSDFLSQLFSVMSFANKSTKSRSGYENPGLPFDVPDIVWPVVDPFKENDSRICSLVQKINDIIDGREARDRKRKGTFE